MSPDLRTGKKFDELLKKWGIDDMKPIGAKRLRKLMIADGIKPEDNEASRGIIAMREERSRGGGTDENLCVQDSP